MSILVLCPTRGRPQALREAFSSFDQTVTMLSSRMLGVVDLDDPQQSRYDEPFLTPEHGGGMVAALNAAVQQVLLSPEPPDIIGFIGDDHRFRTVGWDTAITTALEKPGFAYGYDKFWHEGQIPTQVFISRPIVEALGYFALPTCHHLYVDNAWMALGQATGSIHWLRDVVIEHMHPAVGKAEWDEGYRLVNSDVMYEHDGNAFANWRESHAYQEDVAKVQAVVG